MTGKFYGVGVGPGDARMLTKQGMEVLEKGDVICAPISQLGRESSALKVVEELVEGKEIMELVFPMTKDEEVLKSCWEKAGRQIMAQLEKGHDVAFITLGDPTFYSTFLYVLEELRNKEVEIETVPGVTSLSACLAAGNVALAIGEDKVAVLPASKAKGKLEALLGEFDSIVLMKAKDLRDVARELRTLDMEGAARVFTKCGSKEFASYPLSALKEKKLDYFSMVLIRSRKK
ncbi:MAG: precorrin-2 C(20)-methyltransferase [Candidatus Hydrothermarchaeota archaeon]|nr:precorrin-2 C(20)-methyltransferase [Candidatus Hydrothermarchaeota archaeon]